MAWSQALPTPDAAVDAAPGSAPKTVADAPIQPPTLETLPPAPYTDEARAAGVEGVVRMVLTIDADGRVEAVSLMEGLGHGLDASAMQALHGARFRPATQEGRPVAVRVVFEQVFTLQPALAEEWTLTHGPTLAIQRALALRGGGGSLAKERFEEAVSLEDAEGAEASPAAAELAGLEAASSNRYQATVRGTATETRALVRSAEAVEVVTLERARERGGDLGEVLTRGSAVQVQRTGGLGSRTQLTLGGLSGDQVRVLIDGVPITYSPYVNGLGNVPVALFRQLEVFNGVVPIRLATDALAGAIHLAPSVERSGRGPSSPCSRDPSTATEAPRGSRGARETTSSSEVPAFTIAPRTTRSSPSPWMIPPPGGSRTVACTATMTRTSRVEASSRSGFRRWRWSSGSFSPSTPAASTRRSLTTPTCFAPTAR